MVEWIFFMVLIAVASFVAGIVASQSLTRIDRSWNDWDAHFTAAELESLQAAHEVLMAELNEHRKLNAELDYLKPSSELERCQ
jgi:hypothetical protein